MVFGTLIQARAAAARVTRLATAAVAVMAPALDASPDEFSGQLVAGLAALAQALGRDLAEADWWRLLDALVLVAAHPAAS